MYLDEGPNSKSTNLVSLLTVQVKLSGRSDHPDIIWAGKGILATCTGESVIRYGMACHGCTCLVGNVIRLWEIVHCRLKKSMFYFWLQCGSLMFGLKSISLERAEISIDVDLYLMIIQLLQEIYEQTIKGLHNTVPKLQPLFSLNYLWGNIQ